jgi:rod shape-determining protein MreD
LFSTLLVVFLESSLGGMRRWVAAQPDLLPALVVYAALTANLPTTLATALLGGLALDALSSGPFGLSVLPLSLLGVLLHIRRDLLLRESGWAQAFLGGTATLAVAVSSLALLFLLWPLVSGRSRAIPFLPEQRAGMLSLPALGPGLLWQFLFLALVGAVATPLIFRFFRWIEATFHYRPAPQPALRPDREIQRGRF